MKSSIVTYIIRVVMLLLLLALTATWAWGEIPPQANSFRRQYIQIMRMEIGLDAPIATLAGQIAQESMFNCRVSSPVGAQGCAQFMPKTANWIGDIDSRLKGGDVFSPAWAFRAQAVYMEWLFNKVKADSDCQRWAFAMSAYNGGLGYVYKRQKLSSRPGTCFGFTCKINPGILAANQKENEEYPVRIEFKWAPQFNDAGWGEKACRQM